MKFLTDLKSYFENSLLGCLKSNDGRNQDYCKICANLKAGCLDHVPGPSLQLDVPLVQLMSDDTSLYSQTPWLRNLKIFFF